MATKVESPQQPTLTSLTVQRLTTAARKMLEMGSAIHTPVTHQPAQVIKRAMAVENQHIAQSNECCCSGIGQSLKIGGSYHN